jgi:hypothetical protein
MTVGLHIYFCDICGVRVIDVDLRSGHGLLRGHQVICGTCLEMGHGGAWLEGRPGQITSVTPDPNPVINAARDRAVTVPDPDPPAPRLDTKDTVRVLTPLHVGASDLSSVATSLGAMHAAHSGTASNSEGVDDLVSVEAPPTDLEDAVATMSTEHPETPFNPAADADESSALQPAVGSSSARSKAVTRASVAAAKSKPEVGKASSASSSRRPAVKPPSSKSTKSSSKSARRAKATGGLPMPVLVTIGGVVLIALVAVGAISAKGGKRMGEGEVIDPGESRKKMVAAIGEARKEMNAALTASTKELAQLRAAEAKFQAAQAKTEAFEALMRKHSQWTEDQIYQAIEDAGMQDLGAKSKAIRDEIAKQMAR